MILTPAQNTIASDLHRFRIVNCGRRFGKTTLAAEEIKGIALARPARIAYIATTYQQARDIIWQILKKELSPITLNVNESRLEITVRTLDGLGESIIFLRGWEAVDSLRGQYFDFLVIDEIASMKNFQEGWEEVLRPTLTDKKGTALFISTPKGFNHFYELYNKETDENPEIAKDYKSFHFTSYDNPHIDKSELDDARSQLPEDTFAQEYLADFRKQQGLVYKEFNREKHLYSDDKLVVNEVQRFAGIDFGHTNPCAVIEVVKDYDDNYWITDEWYERKKSDEEIAEYVAAEKFNFVYPDPEAPSSILALRKKGVNCRVVVKNKDSIKNGIDRVRTLFQSGKLKIHTRCKNLILELETYSYPEKKAGKNEYENPIKENDHAVDALRYALFMNTSASNGRPAKQFYPHLQSKSQKLRYN